MLRFLSITILSIALFLPQRSAGFDHGSIALVGGGFGATEVDAIAEHVLSKDSATFTVEKCGTFLEAADYAKYGTVVVASEIERPYTRAEADIIEGYLEQGGILLLIQQAPKYFKADDSGKENDDAYLFGKSYFHHGKARSEIFTPSDPLLEGVFPEGHDSRLLQEPTYIMLKNASFENLAGADEFILIGRKTFGKGQVIYLGHELFRILSPKSKFETRSEAESWMRLLMNIFQMPRAD